MIFNSEIEIQIEEASLLKRLSVISAIERGLIMKLVSWNVNGLRACLNKGFLEYFKDIDADIFSIQETKLQEGQVELDLNGYEQYWNCAVKKGYSGTAVFTKHTPLSVAYGMGIEEHDQEGRIITLEFENFYLVNVYTPNSQRGLTRLDYRMKWEDAFRDYLLKLDAKKPVISCGDKNVAHKEIDLKNPKNNRTNAGFTDEERQKMTELLEAGFVDSFRHLYPDKEGAYTWWSYMFKARERNIGWRIDYFIVSDRFRNHIVDSMIDSHVLGSDHCPIVLEINRLQPKWSTAY
jgi:exodeoxyribonuclease-3